MTLEQVKRMEFLSEKMLAGEASEEEILEYQELLEMWNIAYQLKELP
ncbi:hypothetical protein J7384_08745 [Endozoicomonas sp. G2_1]|nr:hypothetical protein [Endozoicomonas sp. G2_1]MBO9490448.1 hypothetical protein [Endozoicomonas sp. G2_1]